MGFFLIIVIGVVGFIVQNRLQSVFSKYSKVLAPNGMTGREAAEKMLRDYGIRDVKVVSTMAYVVIVHLKNTLIM